MNHRSKKKIPFTLFFISLILILLILILISLCSGHSALALQRIPAILMGQGDFKENFIFYQIRLPRIILTTLVGAALAFAGTILQGITKNPLADPGVIGINAGAGLAIAITFLFIPLEAQKFGMILPVIGMVGGLIAGFLPYTLSIQRYRGIQVLTYTLIGVGCATALSGAMMVVISATDRTKVDFIAKWLAGNLWGTDWQYILGLIPWLLIIGGIAVFKLHTLNLLQFDDVTAINLGVKLAKERIILLSLAILASASAAAIAGNISFIGLMAPHLAKKFVSSRFQQILPTAVLLGAIFLVLADTISRSVLPTPIPTGIIVAIIGAPYFLYLMKST